MGQSLGINPYRGDIPAEQIVRGMELIDRNSREILDDARLLLENGRNARALALAVIALEESAKKSALLILYAVQANSELRKKIWREYRSHTSKASFLVRRPALRGAFEGQNIEEKAQRMGKIMDLYKQLGLYADSYEFDEGSKSWSIPSESISSKMAEETFEIVSKQVGGFLDEKEEEELKSLRWQIIQAVDEYPQDQILERIRATARSSVASAKDTSGENSDFANDLERAVRPLLGEEDTPPNGT